MNGELGFAQFIPMAMSAASTIQQKQVAKSAKKKASKQKATDAILKALSQTNKPVKIKKATPTKTASIKIAKPTSTTAYASGSSASRGILDSEFTHKVDSDSKNTILFVGVGLGVLFLFKK
ncbi:hypothetical protein EHQ99_18055 [Leptospira bouyouniensis]|nr:hypothetical protein EHQ99_18055 [Leptospira bouyouniensis]